MTDKQLAILLEYIRDRLESTRATIYELLKDDLEIEKRDAFGSSYKCIEELSALGEQIADLNEQIESLRDAK